MHRILSPRILNLRILNPRILSPRIISPRIISPRILSPRILTPRILSPRILSRRILSPKIVSLKMLSNRWMGKNLLYVQKLSAAAKKPATFVMSLWPWDDSCLQCFCWKVRVMCSDSSKQHEWHSYSSSGRQRSKSQTGWQSHILNKQVCGFFYGYIKSINVFFVIKLPTLYVCYMLFWSASFSWIHVEDSVT